MDSGISILKGDVAKLPFADGEFDLVFTSPPYEDARFYGKLDFKMKGGHWVEWAVPRFLECLRVTKGLCCWVVQGRTRDFSWSCVPMLLVYKLHYLGVCLRCPPIYHRVGIPGSGGPDWWRNDYEFVICATHGGELPWSDNTASGQPPKFPVGGPPSHRMPDGRRVNKLRQQRDPSGARIQGYAEPKIANPGNVLSLGAVGGGHMGSPLAHETEAPFPEKLVEPFIKCFCPPDGIVLDPMCGSGTTLAVALKHGRRAVGVDIRQSQVDLARRRVAEAASPLFQPSARAIMKMSGET